MNNNLQNMYDNINTVLQKFNDLFKNAKVKLDEHSKTMLIKKFVEASQQTTNAYNYALNVKQQQIQDPNVSFNSSPYKINIPPMSEIIKAVAMIAIPFSSYFFVSSGALALEEVWPPKSLPTSEETLKYGTILTIMGLCVVVPLAIHQLKESKYLSANDALEYADKYIKKQAKIKNKTYKQIVKNFGHENVRKAIEDYLIYAGINPNTPSIQDQITELEKMYRPFTTTLSTAQNQANQTKNEAEEQAQQEPAEIKEIMPIELANKNAPNGIVMMSFNDYIKYYTQQNNNQGDNQNE